MSLYTLDYIGNKPGSEEIYTHASTIDNTLIIARVIIGRPELKTKSVIIK